MLIKPKLTTLLPTTLINAAHGMDMMDRNSHVCKLTFTNTAYYILLYVLYVGNYL
jgi:hypothetical protein